MCLAIVDSYFSAYSFTMRSIFSPFILSLNLGFTALAFPAQGADLTAEFDARHQACLESIAEDQEAAYEAALAWRDEGGGRRAKHCVAMALFALGHADEAAFRLDALAKSSDGGSPSMRADFYAEAANFWLSADEPNRAYASASAGLDIAYNHLDLRVSRARAYAVLGRYDYAQTDLTSVLTLDPLRDDALRYRADTYLKQDNLTQAKADIEAALKIAPTSVESALLRGQINETIRLEGQK